MRSKTSTRTIEDRRAYSRERDRDNRRLAKEYTVRYGVRVTVDNLKEFKGREKALEEAREGAAYWAFLCGKELNGVKLSELSLRELNGIRDVFREPHFTARDAECGRIDKKRLRAGVCGYILNLFHTEGTQLRGNPGLAVLEELGV